jgi:hypothetical protein
MSHHESDTPFPTGPRRNYWLAVGYAGVSGDWTYNFDRPYLWTSTYTMVLDIGMRLGTFWQTRPR